MSGLQSVNVSLKYGVPISSASSFQVASSPSTATFRYNEKTACTFDSLPIGTYTAIIELDLAGGRFTVTVTRAESEATFSLTEEIKAVGSTDVPMPQSNAAAAAGAGAAPTANSSSSFSSSSSAGPSRPALPTLFAHAGNPSDRTLETDFNALRKHFEKIRFHVTELMNYREECLSIARSIREGTEVDLVAARTDGATKALATLEEVKKGVKELMDRIGPIDIKIKDEPSAKVAPRSMLRTPSIAKADLAQLEVSCNRFENSARALSWELSFLQQSAFAMRCLASKNGNTTHRDEIELFRTTELTNVTITFTPL